MLNFRQKFGKFGETFAARHIKKLGYQIICRNYRTKLGEIDIIAKENDTIVFVEVKSRRTSTFGHPKYSITPKKQKQISKTALYYLKSTNQSNVRARFDVVTVISVNGKPNVEIFKNAFELAYK
jgi:putative endonuclease